MNAYTALAAWLCEASGIVETCQNPKEFEIRILEQSLRFGKMNMARIAVKLAKLSSSADPSQTPTQS